MQNYLINKDWLMLVGRILFSLTFFIFLFGKFIFNFNLALFYKVGAGFSSFSQIFLVIVLIIELFGSLLILVGWYTRLGAILIFLYILGVTFAFHSFWIFPSSEFQNELTHFLKNAAMLGGCLYIIAFGGGRYSLDYFRGAE